MVEGRKPQQFSGESYRIRDREPHFNSWFASLPSIEHPERNEDAVLIDRQKGVIGVFDGMGGEAAGDEASLLSAAVFRSRLTLPTSPSEALAGFEGSFTIACERLATKEVVIPRGTRMGTTVTIAQVVEDEGERSLAFLHAGNSRLYIVKEDGQLQQVTRDDNFVELDRRSGELTDALAAHITDLLNNLTTEEEAAAIAPYFNDRHVVINGITSEGSSPPQVGVLAIQPEDRLLLVTTDGVHDNLTRSEIAQLVQSTPSDKLAQELTQVAMTVSRGSSIRSMHDDITAAVTKL